MRRFGNIVMRAFIFIAIVSCMDPTPKKLTQKEIDLKIALQQAIAGDEDAMDRLIENGEDLTETDKAAYKVLDNFAKNSNILSDMLVEELRDQLTVKHTYDYVQHQ